MTVDCRVQVFSSLSLPVHWVMSGLVILSLQKSYTKQCKRDYYYDHFKGTLAQYFMYLKIQWSYRMKFISRYFHISFKLHWPATSIQMSGIQVLHISLYSVCLQSTPTGWTSVHVWQQSCGSGAIDILTPIGMGYLNYHFMDFHAFLVKGTV